MPDIEIIEKHLSLFISDLENLKKHRDVTLEEIKNNKDLLWILERGISSTKLPNFLTSKLQTFSLARARAINISKLTQNGIAGNIEVGNGYSKNI